MGTTTTPDAFYKATPGEKGWGGRTNENWDVLQAVLEDLRGAEAGVIAAEAAHEADASHLHIRVSEPPPILHRSPNGDDSFDGRWDRPFLTTQAAYNALSALGTGGKILVRGTETFAAPLDMHGAVGVEVEGIGPANASAAPAQASVLIYSGTGANAVNAQNAKSCKFKSIFFRHSNAAFVGPLLDLKGPISDSSQNLVENCGFAGTGNFGAIGVDLDGSSTNTIRSSNFHALDVGIYGARSGGHAVAVTIEGDCHFSAGTGNIITAAIKNAGNLWVVKDSSFEPLTSGGAGAFKYDTGCLQTGITWEGNWFGDVDSGDPGSTWLLLEGTGLVVHANYMGGPVSDTTTHVKINGNNCIGIEVTGNIWKNGFAGVDFGTTTGHRAVVIKGNYDNSVATPVAGTIPAGQDIHDGTSQLSAGRRFFGQAGFEASMNGEDTPGYHGLKAWNFPLSNASTSAAIATGSVFAYRVLCQEAFTASQLWVNIRTAGSGLTSGQNLIGLYNAAGQQIGTCPDQSTAWTATAEQPAALTVVGGQSLAIAANSYVWVVVLSVGTTPPNFYSCNAVGSNAINTNVNGASIKSARQATAQTALPSSFTPSALSKSNPAIPIWVGVS